MFKSRKFYIAGVQFHNAKKVINQMAEGNMLQLIPEPDNKYDPNAVRIIFGNTSVEEMLGFVPKKFSSEVAAALEIGTRLACKVTTLTPGAKPWEQIEVEVYDFENTVPTTGAPKEGGEND